MSLQVVVSSLILINLLHVFNKFMLENGYPNILISFPLLHLQEKLENSHPYI